MENKFTEKVKLHFFNPENDLALACGNSNYCSPPSARAIAANLATLPLWFAPQGDCVFCEGDVYRDYYNKMSRLFSLPMLFERNLLKRIDGCSPWGWSAFMRRRLKDIGVCEDFLPTRTEVDKLRELSNRRNVITILERMRDAGIDTPAPPQYCVSPDEAARFVNSVPRSVVKAPWSGSGKGIAWGIGRVEAPVEHFYKGVIKRQGAVLCECFLDKVIDFAMEYKADDGAVCFSGYSLFTCVGGAYSGNILASDNDIERFLQSYISADVLENVKSFLCKELAAFLSGSGYNGFLGVDMLVYKDSSSGFRLYPCVEINLRMNMGAVSRIFYDNFVLSGRVGRFFVKHYRLQGDALVDYEKNCAIYPSCIVDGKVVSGAFYLSPVTIESRYAAFAIIDQAGEVSSLYPDK